MRREALACFPEWKRNEKGESEGSHCNQVCIPPSMLAYRVQSKRNQYQRERGTEKQGSPNIQVEPLVFYYFENVRALTDSGNDTGSFRPSSVEK